MAERKRACRTKSQHQALMLDFFEEYPFLVTQNFSAPNARQKYNEKWDELKIKLNAMGMGEKTTNQWQRVLSDWLSKIKLKISTMKKEKTATGGGPSSQLNLTDLEERVMNIKGWSAVEGDGVTTEAGFGKIKEIQTQPQVIPEPEATERDYHDIDDFMDFENNTPQQPHVELVVTNKQANKSPSQMSENYVLFDLGNKEVHSTHNAPTLTKKNTKRTPLSDGKVNINVMHRETLAELSKVNDNLGSINTTLSLMNNNFTELVVTLKKIHAEKKESPMFFHNM